MLDEMQMQTVIGGSALCLSPYHLNPLSLVSALLTVSVSCILCDIPSQVSSTFRVPYPQNL